MNIVKFPLDKRLIKINGREVEILLRLQVDEDHNMVELTSTIDHGDPESNRRYLAKFESGELLNVHVKAIAELEMEHGSIRGEDLIPGVHIKPLDYDDDAHADVKARVLELAEHHGIVDKAIEDLAENIRRNLERFGIDSVEVEVAV